MSLTKKPHQIIDILENLQIVLTTGLSHVKCECVCLNYHFFPSYSYHRFSTVVSPLLHIILMFDNPTTPCSQKIHSTPAKTSTICQCHSLFLICSANKKIKRLKFPIILFVFSLKHLMSSMFVRIIAKLYVLS